MGVTKAAQVISEGQVRHWVPGAWHRAWHMGRTPYLCQELGVVSSLSIKKLLSPHVKKHLPKM